MEKIYQRYKDQIDFYAVYIREAHPSDGWTAEFNVRFNINIEQPKTKSKRNEIATTCGTSLGLTMPVLVDEMDDRVNRAYSGFPDRLYLIDENGKVAYKGGRGPFGYKPRELEQTIIMMLLDKQTAAQGLTASP